MIPLVVASGILFESSIDFAPVGLITIKPTKHLIYLFGVHVARAASLEDVDQVLFKLENRAPIFPL